MSFWVLKNFAVVQSTVSRITKELEKIKIEVDPKLSSEYQNNPAVRRGLQLLTYAPEFKVLTHDQHYLFPHLQGSNLNFNLINAMQLSQGLFEPSLRLLALSFNDKYLLTANNLNDFPSYQLRWDIFLETPLFFNLENPHNPLFKTPIKTYVLAQGNGGVVKMGFRNNMMDENPEQRFVEFSTPRFFSSTYKQEHQTVIQDSYGICMRTKSSHMVKVLFRLVKGQLKLETIYDRHRTYDPRYFFRAYKLIESVFDYLQWATEIALQARKNPLVQERIAQGLIKNNEFLVSR